MPARDLVVYCAAVTWDDVPGTDVNLVKALRRSVDVLWVDPPQSLAQQLRARVSGSSDAGPPPAGRHGDRLTIVGPPGPTRAGIRRLTAWQSRRTVAAALREDGRRPVGMVVSTPEPWVGRLPGVPYLYFATDDYAAGAALMQYNAAVLARAETQQLRVADRAAAVSAAILERWDVGDRAFLLPNGCDVEHYAAIDSAPWPLDVWLPGPRAGVVGQLSSRLDLSLLEAVVDTGVALLLVGPWVEGFENERVSRLLSRPNVEWVGRKRYDDLPSYLRTIDVGLTPYADTEFNRASDPLKTLEYLAAGRPVVSTPLPAVDRLSSPDVVTAATPGEFAAATVALLDEAAAGARGSQRARETARLHSWDARADQVLAALLEHDATPAREG